MNSSVKYIALWMPSLLVGIISATLFFAIYSQIDNTSEKRVKRAQIIRELTTNLELVISETAIATILGSEERFLGAVNTSNRILDNIDALKKVTNWNVEPIIKKYQMMYKHLVIFVSFAKEGRTKDALDAYTKVQELTSMMTSEVLALTATMREQERKDIHRLVYLMVASVAVLIGVSLFAGLYLIPKMVINPMRSFMERLQKSEEKFRIVADWTYDWEYWLDQDRRVVYMSPSVERITGYSVSEFEKDENLIDKIIHPDDVDKWHLHTLEAHLPNRPENDAMNLEIRVVCKDGSSIYIEHICRPVYDKNGKNLGVRVANRDITARKNMELMLKELSEHLSKAVEEEVAKRMDLEREKKSQEMILIQQSKLAEMGEMIAAITHQWKQPLNALSLYAQMIPDCVESGEMDDAKVIEISEFIKKQVSYMNQTINDFKNFLSPSKERVNFDVAAAIRDVEMILTHLISKKGIEFSIHQDEPSIVNGYQNEFKQALINIIKNGADTIEERKIQDGKIAVHISKTKESVMIKICDNAGGIPESLLPDKLFEPYITTKGERGTGIGLQLVKKIFTERFGGTIVAYNTDVGACFEIKIPKTTQREKHDF